MTCLTAV